MCDEGIRFQERVRLGQRGFTLVELMIVALLLIVFGGGLMTTFLTGQTSYLSADAYIQVQQEARKAFDNIMRDLRESGNISCGAQGTGCPTAASTTQQLNFQIALGFNLTTTAGCPASAICWGTETQANQWVHYVITGQGNNVQLVRCLTSGQTDPMPASYAGCRVLANSVKGGTSSFSWDSAPANRTVTIRLEIETQNAALPTGRQTTNVLTSQVKLRN